jgi:ribosome-binding factor A
MSNRTVRINELVQRELSSILRKRYQAESVAITITAVEVSPDLHDGKVHVAVTGDAAFAEEKLRWLKAKAPEFRHELSQRIVLKFMPLFVYLLDESTARGNRLLHLMDEISAKESRPEEKTGQGEKS